MTREKVGHQNEPNSSDQLIYLSKIGGLDLKNNMFKLIQFQSDLFTHVSFFIFFLGKEI